MLRKASRVQYPMSTFWFQMSQAFLGTSFADKAAVLVWWWCWTFDDLCCYINTIYVFKQAGSGRAFSRKFAFVMVLRRSLWNGMSKRRTDGCYRMNIMKVVYLSWYLRTKKMYCPLLWMGRFFPAALSIFYALAHTLLHPPLATIHMICGSELFNGTGHTGSSPFLNKDYMIFGRSIDFWCTVSKTKKRTWKMKSFTKYVHYGITDHVHFSMNFRSNWDDMPKAIVRLNLCHYYEGQCCSGHIRIHISKMLMQRKKCTLDRISYANDISFFTDFWYRRTFWIIMLLNFVFCWIILLPLLKPLKIETEIAYQTVFLRRRKVFSYSVFLFCYRRVVLCMKE